MKFWMIIAVFCLVSAAEAQTYRAGGTARPNFGSGQAEEKQEESSVPGARSNVQTRTFSSYGSRQQRDWSKGVQTQGVRTNTAGSAEYTDKADEQAARAAAALGVGKKEAAPATLSGKKPAKAAAGAQPSAKGAANNAAPAAAQPGQDANAMLQQVQAMMQGLGGAPAGGNASGGKAAGGMPSIPGMPAGMNVPGMPDVSALMNAAAAGQQPAKK